MTEKQFENKFKKWLESQGVYRLGTYNKKCKGYYLKRWGGGMYTPAGLPDMQVVINGRCIEIELKSETGRLSELQKHKIQCIKNAGGTAFVLSPKNFEKNKIFLKKYLTN